MTTLRKTWGSFKDTTTVSIAKINSEYKELDVAVIKATNHIEIPPKEKHVRTIFAYTSATRPRADVAYCIHALAKRLGKTGDWVVALKTLMVIHRTLREGDPTFREELINYSRSRGHMLNLANFKDESGPGAWDYSAWVRVYALFLEERLESFRVLKYDVESERSSGHSKTRELDTPELLEHLPALQGLLHRLMGCWPEGVAINNHIVQAALGLVLKESFKLYRAINDGIINLVDKFFEMQKHDAAKSLEIYKRAGQQAERLSEFYDMCKSLDLARSFQFPALEQPPTSFLTTMEEYVQDSRPPPAARESTAESFADDRPQRPPPPPEPVVEDEPPPPPPPTNEPADLLGLDDTHNMTGNASQLDYDNALALAIVPQGANGNGQSAMSMMPNYGTSGWELALVAAPSSTQPTAPVVDPQGSQKLAGGFDRLTLDSLYEDAIKRATPPNSYGGGPASQPGGMLALPAPPGAFQTSFRGPQDPFAASGGVAPPPSVQMADMAVRQHALFGQPGMMPQSQYGQPQQYGMNPQVQYGAPGSYGAPSQMTPNPFGSPYGVPPQSHLQPQMQQAMPQGYQGSNPFGNPNLL